MLGFGRKKDAGEGTEGTSTPENNEDPGNKEKPTPGTAEGKGVYVATNATPHGHEGPNHRETFFPSADNKHEIDAERVLRHAQRYAMETGVTVNPETLLTRRSDNERTQREIKRKIGKRIKLQLAEIEEEERICDLIDAMDLSPEQKAKLIKMMSLEDFRISEEVARFADKQNLFPTYVSAAEEFKNLTPEELRRIDEMMIQPELLIVPGNTLKQKLDEAKKNNHEIVSNEEILLNSIEQEGETEARIVIADGVKHPKNYMSEGDYKNRGLSPIGPDEMAMLLLKSMRGSSSKKGTYPIDSYRKGEVVSVTRVGAEERGGRMLISCFSIDRRLGVIREQPIEKVRGVLRTRAMIDLVKGSPC